MVTPPRAERRPVRVLHLMQDVNSGGVERTHLSIIRGLTAPAWEHAVICTQAMGPVAAAYADLGVPVVETGPVRSVFAPGRYRLATRFVRDWRPDLIHGSVNEGYILGGIVGAWTRTPFLMEETSEPVGRRLQGHILTRIMAGLADHTFGVSPAVGHYLTHTIRVPHAKVSVVNNGVERPAAPSPARLEALRVELALEPEDLVVGSIGRIHDENKGFSDLIRAVARLEDLPVKLVIVGDGPDLPALRRLASEAGLQKHVHFAGFQAEPGHFYALMNVFALASRFEAFGMVIAEAMRTGLAVVGTRVGGIPTIVTEEETGLLVPPRDPVALAAALRRLLEDAPLRLRMGAAAKERADRLFSAERYVADIRSLYEHALHRSLPAFP